MFFKIYRKRDIIKKKAPSFKGHPSTTSDLILMILPPLDSLELGFLMVCVLFNLNKYWARYYKKHFFKKFYTVLIRTPKFISGTCIYGTIHPKGTKDIFLPLNKINFVLTIKS